MQISLTARHFAMTAALQEHAEAKARKACSHLTNLPSRCKLVLIKDAHLHNAEISLHYHGHDLSAHGDSSADMYAAIDQAAARLKRQLDDLSSRESHNRG